MTTIHYAVTLPNGAVIICTDKHSADRLSAFVDSLPAKPAPRKPPARRPAAKKPVNGSAK